MTTIRRGFPKALRGKCAAVASGAFRVDRSYGFMLLNAVLPSCFNAFSRVDVRVDVKIPGGVLAYVIDLRGERYYLVP